MCVIDNNQFEEVSTWKLLLSQSFRLMPVKRVLNEGIELVAQHVQSRVQLLDGAVNLSIPVDRMAIVQLWRSSLGPAGCVEKALDVRPLTIELSRGLFADTRFAGANIQRTTGATGICGFDKSKMLPRLNELAGLVLIRQRSISLWAVEFSEAPLWRRHGLQPLRPAAVARL